MMGDGLVSVIMPLYNAEKYVAAAIDSVIAQSYDNWELIIVDDGSTDGSLAVASSYSSDRIRILSQPNHGACVARNKALLHAKGNYVKFLDADDLLAPDCIKLQMENIRTLEGSRIPFGDYDFVDSTGDLTYSYSFDKEALLYDDQPFFFFSHWEILISAPLHRKHLIDAVGGFDTSLKRGQEFDFHFRLALAGCEFVHFPVKTFSYRSHDSASRISTGTKNRTYATSGYLADRYDKFEWLLTEKYGEVPQKYHANIFDFWFSWARESFANKCKPAGMASLEKAALYAEDAPSFYRVYNAVGRVMGYQCLESVLRLRLKVKNFFRHKESRKGTTQYI